MRKVILKIILPLSMVFVFTTLSFAVQTRNIQVTANVPPLSMAFNVTVSKIRALDNFWEQSGSDLPINFGTLTYDPGWNIFRATHYYAVDIGVTDNTGTIWTVAHLTNSIRKGADTLDNNVNVTFMKQTLDNPSGSDLQKVSFAASNGVAYNKNELSGGWLRIYYGIASGSGDAPGVRVVGIDKPTGTYTGSVTIRLAP